MKSIIIFLLSCTGVWLHAQTTGPTQPEVNSFTPIGASDMVDLYSGDFNYNIPLLVVPGPDGGYPINMAYSSNVTPGDVPTWVGLSFNLNAGAIVRNKRGIPDDFRGDGNTPDLLDKTIYIKPKKNIAITLAPIDMEIFSADLGLKGKFTLYFDNYKGFGVKAGVDLVPVHENTESKMKSNGPSMLGLNFDSKEGVMLTPRLSMDHLLSKKEKDNDGGTEEDKNKGIGKTIQSVQGKIDKLKSFRVGHYSGLYFDQKGDIQITEKDYMTGFNLSFAKHAPIASISIPRNTLSLSYATTYDFSALYFKNKSISLQGNYSVTNITNPQQNVPMYGSLYTEHRKNDQQGVMDYYRENETPVSKETPVLPLTIQSFDVFNIQGHGIGGAFRLYRNSVGQYKPQYSESKATNIDLGVDVGVGPNVIDMGVDANFAMTQSYSGTWEPRRINTLKDYNFKSKNLTNPLYQPAYFKLIGESTPLPISEWNNMEKDKPIAFDLGDVSDLLSKPLSFKPKAFSTYNSGRNNLSLNKSNKRNPRVISIEYKTKKQLVDRTITDNVYKAKHIVKTNSVEPIYYVSNRGKDHHINEISVRKSNGVVYNYALPAYNWDEEKVTFATDQKDPGRTKKVPIAGLNRVENKLSDNLKGSDDYYSREVTPAYAHTYFLTSIHSMDYIDIKNDGCTDDDLGSWTKFYYEKIDGYKWRFPFDNQMADFIEGYLTNDHDQKATYTQGLKELYYAKAIETKTHFAIFETGNTALVDANLSKPQKYLKKISLYSKSDPKYVDEFYLNSNHGLTPIKEVHFAYDYSLKANTSNQSTIPNFDKNIASTDNIVSPIGQAGQNGTLTLKELWFTYKNNRVGADSKYHFEYENNIPHPVAFTQDRWGAYQDKIGSFDPYENPYTYQETYTNRNQNAALWCLSKITLPSDGELRVDYEKDDYAFVQNKKAMQYVPITGYGNGSTFVPSNATDSKIVDLKTLNRIYFKANNLAEAKARTAGIKDLNFKVFMFLNRVKSIGQSPKNHEDYVNGYISRNDIASIGYEATRGGFVEINYVAPTNTATYKLHPIQIATIQYIRNFRSDIQTSFEFNTSNPITWVQGNFSKLYKAIKPLFSGYYKDKASKGWGQIVVETKPSFLKLNSINQKYGGGNRVRKITLDPKALDGNVYGKEYSYDLPDGTSSGVAEMEPITGHEENALIKLERYTQATGNKVLYIQKETENSFVETPHALGLHPGPKIGYSRVIERALTNPDVSKSQDGISVFEFFTAKDFPTKVRKTSNPFRTAFPPINVQIPFIGHVGINNAGFTMGYAITLNNGIYGRQKRVSVYPYSFGEPSGQPVSMVEYVYKKLSESTLDNKVKFLKKEGEVVDAYLGKEYDFYIEQYENGNITMGGGIRPDIKINVVPPIPAPSLMPSIQYYENVSSYLTTTKVIYNSPILKETIQYKDGAKVISSNLFYDYETGQPIITAVTNEFQDNVYSYNFPAHWTYDRMDGAYKNQGAAFNVKDGSGNKFQLNDVTTNCADILFEGDELMIDQKKYFVSNINRNTNDFDLKDRLNIRLSLSGSSLKKAYIERSGFRNLQSVSKGGIMSLEDHSGFDFFTNDMSNGEVYRKPILQANAVEFIEDWDLNFSGLPDQLTNANGKTLSDIYENGTANPYAFGKLGIPRALRTWAYIQSRKQNENPVKGAGAGLKISEDGTFDYFPFNWVEDTLYNERADWRWVNHVTRYHANGNSEEGENRLHQFTASLSGYKNFLITASAQNAEHQEIAFDGFEDYDLDATNNHFGDGHGNFNFNRYWLYPEGHTGAYSFNLADGLACPTCYFEFESDLNGTEIFFTPKTDKKYVLSFWTKFSDRNNMPFNPPPTKVQVLSGNTVLKTFTVDPMASMIDGWYKVEGEFEMPTSASKFKLRLFTVEDDDVLLDDLRIQPFNSSMKTYVYDPKDYSLQAILNDHNYFVEFIYDSEGGLIQKNVETDRGKKTISINRSNISQK